MSAGSATASKVRAADPAGGAVAAAPQAQATAKPANALYALDAHDVPKTAPVPGVTPQEDAIICRKESTTGSRFYRKVCYSRREVEARAKMDQETLYRWRLMQ